VKLTTLLTKPFVDEVMDVRLKLIELTAERELFNGKLSCLI